MQSEREKQPTADAVQSALSTFLGSTHEQRKDPKFADAYKERDQLAQNRKARARGKPQQAD